MPDPFPDQSRSRDFRFVYANAFGVQFNGTELILHCGIQRDIAQPLSGSEEQVAVVMSAPAMKTLGLMLSQIVQNHELVTGQPIPISPEAQAALKQAFQGKPVAEPPQT